MRTARALFVFFSITLLSACGGSITNWHNANDFSNFREYGTVVSQREGHSLSSDISQKFGSLFGPPSVPKEQEPITQVEYVVQKDNGQKVTITQAPDDNEPIFFPGQRVMIQNNDGYVRVVSPDPEYKY